MSTTGQTLEAPAREAKRRAASGSGWYAWLARAGLIAKGASFVLVGALAIKLAAGDGGRATSREGALEAIASETFGQILLPLLALGFTCYACWRFVEAFATDSDNEGKTWAKRVGSIGRGLIYAALAGTTVKLLIGAGSSGSQNERAHKTTAVVLSWPAGTWLVGLVGAAIVGAGLWNAYRGLARSFEERWATGRMSEAARTWGGRAGLAGHLARAVVFTLIGWFVIKAALEYDASEAIGLDGALQKLAGTNYGPYLLGATAAGLICYGLYCFVDARYRDVSAKR